MKKILLLLAVASLFLWSCKKNENGPSGNKAHVTVKITDAPGDYDAILLNIKQIEIRTDGGKEVINLHERPFDILQYRNGRDTVLAGVDIPAGRLQEIRLILYENGNEIIVDGLSHDLKTPSGQSSGVKLKVHENLEGGVAYTLLLDFDAAQSIVQTGNGKYMLKPVIRCIPQAVSGVLTGIVMPITSYPEVYVIIGDERIGGIIDATGRFYFPGLESGTYTLEFVPVSPFKIKVVENVIITNGQVNNLGTITLTE